LEFLGIAFETETLETRSRSLNNIELLAPNRNQDDNLQLWLTKRYAQTKIYSPECFILCVMMHVANNIVLIAKDVQ